MMDVGIRRSGIPSSGRAERLCQSVSAHFQSIIQGSVLFFFLQFTESKSLN